MKKVLRAGVIGLGIGKGHVKNYSDHPGVEVVAIADLNEDRLKETGAKFNIKGLYTDPMKMLECEKLDIVSVATPNKFHKPLTIAALRSGAHVLCEKPMAMSAKEAEEMLAVSRETKNRLMINFSFRFTPQSWQLKKEVESGILGEVYFARTQWLRRRGLPGFGGWFGQKALSGGGPLIDLGVHRLDLALWLMGYPEPVWVMGSTHNPIGSRLAKEQGKAFDVEDFASAMISFKNGSTLQLLASWASNIKEKELMETRLLGTTGGLIQHNVGEGYDFAAEIYIERNGCQYNMQPCGNIPSAGSAMHHFADSILSGKPHTATGEEGLTVMRLLDAIYASAKKGSPVQVVGKKN
jgi:predicted dehydrogenase